MMIIISDTTALSNLLRINQLQLLPKLYGNIIIPETVFDELQTLESFNVSIKPINQASWIKIKYVTNRLMLSDLVNKNNLDLGEAEAIALSIELQANRLLIDEKKGRTIARQYNLSIVGTLGILLEAKTKGFLSNITKEMDKLLKIGFWIHPTLYKKIQRLAKE